MHVYRLYALLGTGPTTLYILFYESCLLTQEPAKLFIQVGCVCVCIHIYIYYISIKQMNNDDDNGGDG